MTEHSEPYQTMLRSPAAIRAHLRLDQLFRAYESARLHGEITLTCKFQAGMITSMTAATSETELVRR